MRILFCYFGLFVFNLIDYSRTMNYLLRFKTLFLTGIDPFVCLLSVSTHRTIMSIYMKKDPRISKDLFVSPSAAVISDVEIRHGSSIWYGSILRGDVNSIRIGSGSNIQDNSLIHVAKTNISGNVLPTIIGSNVPFGVEPITSQNLKV
jgi:UDP-3-O-[3-hydroxymyristoyl] glucosamine N-acyltransferase